MGTVTQTVMPTTTIPGHDGSATAYTLSHDFVIPHGAIGDEMGPIALTVDAYKSDITGIRVNGVACHTSMHPSGSPVTTVLPHDTDPPNGPITVHIYDTPVWTPGATSTFEVDFTRHAQPLTDSDYADVWASASVFYHLGEGMAGPAPLWTWGGNADGQQGKGDTVDVLAPFSSELLLTPITDVVDVSAGGSAGGTRALIRRDADKLEYAAGLASDATTFDRVGGASSWTLPTVHSKSPDHTVRNVWGFTRVAHGGAHGIVLDGWGLRQLYGIGSDATPTGTGGFAGTDPVFTKMATDEVGESVWPYPARAAMVYAGDGFTEVVGVDGDMFAATPPNRVYGAGDPDRLNGGGAGNRFSAVYGESDAQYHRLPNILGEASGARHTVLATQQDISPYARRLTSWGEDDMGQCGRGSVAAVRGAGSVIDFWSALDSFPEFVYVSCGWRGTTVLLGLFGQPPDLRYKAFSWGYPHPMGDTAGVGFLDGFSGATGNYSHTPIEIPLPDLSFPNDIPAPDILDYAYPGGLIDYAADYADWLARPPLVYGVPEWIQHGRGHRLLCVRRPLYANPTAYPNYYCFDFWTQGWNNVGQLGIGTTSSVYSNGWTKVLTLRPSLVGGGAFYGDVSGQVAYDTNYLIGWECTDGGVTPPPSALTGHVRHQIG